MSSLQEKKDATTIKGLMLRKSSFEKLKCTACYPLKVAGKYLFKCLKVLISI